VLDLLTVSDNAESKTSEEFHLTLQINTIRLSIMKKFKVYLKTIINKIIMKLKDYFASRGEHLDNPPNADHLAAYVPPLP